MVKRGRPGNESSHLENYAVGEESSEGNDGTQVSSERVATLGEQVRVEELVLKHLLERKAFLHEEVETIR
jgi:hypothetical protein